MRTLTVILWKNLLIRRNRYIVSTLEILLPICAIAFLVATSRKGDDHFASRYGLRDTNPFNDIKKQENQLFSFFKESTITPWCKQESASIFYAPANAMTDETIQTLVNDVCAGATSNENAGENKTIRTAPFQNETEMEKMILAVLNGTAPPPLNGSVVKAGLVFPDGLKDLKGSDIYATFRYKIRMMSRGTPSTNKLLPVFGDDDFKRVGPISESAQLYYDSNFLSLQYHVDAVLTQLRTNQTRPTKIRLQSMPYPPYREKLNRALSTKGEISAIAFVLPFCLSLMVVMIIPSLVEEKQTGIAELLKLSGAPVWTQLLGWLINFLVPLLVTTPVCVILMYTVRYYNSNTRILYEPVMVYSDWTILLLIVFLYGLASIAMCFFISALFKSPAVATTVGMVWWIGTTIPAGYFPDHSDALLLSLIPNCAFQYAMFLVYTLECLVEDATDEPIGAQWNWWIMNLVDGKSRANVPMYQLLLMLVLDIFLYSLLAVYVYGVFPGQFGIGRPVYWFNFDGRKKSNNRTTPEITPDKTPTNDNTSDSSQTKTNVEDTEARGESTSFEPEADGKLVGIEVRGLSKKYSDGTVAVNKLNMKMYEGDIFVLLGHNGAGKTTLISTLTGYLSPTQGKAIINGYDMAKHLDKARKSMGYCPQHDMLFNELTVSQQIMIFGMLRGLRYSEAKREAEELTLRLGMKACMPTIVRKLSGGLRRKLSLMLALVGKPSILILDECSSGVDVQSRREIWNLLLELRKDRTILLTTHFMEEANILGDRIGIMVKGMLQCCGSSAFLKSYYGTGYTLKLTLPRKENETVSLKDEDEQRETRNTNQQKWKTAPHPATSKVMAVVQKHLPDATPKTGIRNTEDVFIILPSETSTTAALTEMFTDLTANRDKLEIKTMGLSHTTMEDVFIRVAMLADEEYFEVLQGWNADDVKAPIIRKCRFIGDFLVLVRKRGILYIRNWASLLFVVLVAIFMTVLMAVLMQLYVKPTTPKKATENASRVHQEYNEPQLLLSLDKFDSPVSYFSATGSDVVSKGAIAFFLKYAIGSSGKDVGQRSVSRMLIDIGKSNREYYKRNHIVAVSFNANGSVITAMYNAFPYHAAPLAMNTAANTILKSLAPLADYKIQVYNHPFNNATLLQSLAQTRSLADSILGVDTSCPIIPTEFYFAIPIFFGAMMLTTYLIIAPLEERLSQVKHLQLMTGVQPVIYWGAAFFTDYAVYFLVVCLTVALVTVTEFTWPAVRLLSVDNGAGIGVLIAIFMAYGFAAIPFAYFFSFCFSRPVKGYCILLLAQFFYVLFMALPLNLAEAASLLSTLFFALSIILKICTYCIPSMGLFRALAFFVTIAIQNSKCYNSVSGCPKYCPYLLWSIVTLNHIEQEIFIMMLTGLAYHAAILIREYRPLKYLSAWKNNQVFNTGNVYYPGPNVDMYAGQGIQPVEPPPKAGTEKDNASNVDGNADENPQPTADSLSKKGEAVEINVDTHGAGVTQKAPSYIDAGYYGMTNEPMREYLAATGQVEHVDDDVAQEAERANFLAQTGQVGQDCLVVNKIGKTYDQYRGVRNMNIGVHHGECFGLLGMNGAGKTTTFKIISGQEDPAHGDVFGFGTSLGRDRKKFLSNIGYCPQNHCMINCFTGKEMLELFGVLRGMSFSTAKVEAMKWLRIFGLTKSANKRCEQYSGGMKRRLSTALACLGNPTLLLLDECTTGVDASSRHQFHELLGLLRDAGHAIIMTSHSMDECETLCSRLGIMVNGELQCLGGIQHLKDKFGKGYTVTFNLKLDLPYGTDQLARELEKLNAKMLGQFQPCFLRDRHQNVLQYHLETSVLNWDTLFKALEGIKVEFAYLIEDYMVTENTLEDVFLSFVRKQYADIGLGNKSNQRNCNNCFKNCCPK